MFSISNVSLLFCGDWIYSLLSHWFVFFGWDLLKTKKLRSFAWRDCQGLVCTTHIFRQILGEIKKISKGQHMITNQRNPNPMQWHPEWRYFTGYPNIPRSSTPTTTKKEQNSMFCQFVFPKVVVQRSAEMSRIGSPDLPVQSSFWSHRREMFFHCKGICKGWFFKMLLWFVPSWKHGPLLDKQGRLAETDYLHIKLSFYPNYLPL